MRVQPDRAMAPLLTTVTSNSGAFLARCNTHIKPAPPLPTIATSVSNVLMLSELMLPRSRSRTRPGRRASARGSALLLRTLLAGPRVDELIQHHHEVPCDGQPLYGLDAQHFPSGVQWYTTGQHGLPVNAYAAHVAHANAARVAEAQRRVVLPLDGQQHVEHRHGVEALDLESGPLTGFAPQDLDTDHAPCTPRFVHRSPLPSGYRRCPQKDGRQPQKIPHPSSVLRSYTSGTIVSKHDRASRRSMWQEVRIVTLYPVRCIRRDHPPTGPGESIPSVFDPD